LIYLSSLKHFIGVAVKYQACGSRLGQPWCLFFHLPKDTTPVDFQVQKYYY